MTDIANENRRLRSAHHRATLDLDLAVHGLKKECPDEARKWIEFLECVLDRMYREKPTTASAGASPPGLLEQVRAHVHRFTSDKAA